MPAKGRGAKMAKVVNSSVRLPDVTYQAAIAVAHGHGMDYSNFMKAKLASDPEVQAKRRELESKNKKFTA
jgi:hypothetical protein